MPVSRHGRKCHMPNGETEGTKPNPALALGAAPSVTSPRSGQEGLRRGSPHAGCQLVLARRAALARAACRHPLGGTLPPPGTVRPVWPLLLPPLAHPPGNSTDKRRLLQPPQGEHARGAFPARTAEPSHLGAPAGQGAKPLTYVGAVGERLSTRRGVGPHGGRRGPGAESLSGRLYCFQEGAVGPPWEQHTRPAPRRHRPEPQAPPSLALGQGARASRPFWDESMPSRRL